MIINGDIGCLTLKEVGKMLSLNNIEISISVIRNLFALIKPKNPNEVDLDEFIKLSFSNEVNSSKYYYDLKFNLGFRKLVKAMRLKEGGGSSDKFIPYSFPALLSYLSFQASRSNLV